MQLKTVVIFVASLAATASAAPEAEANPIVKFLPARAINVDGSFGGLIFKRQTSCPAGYTACGTGCSLGPCCDNGAGYACRPGENCANINGKPGCCPNGYVCGIPRGCQNGIGGSCTPGSVDSNGIMCCDAAAPICSTSSGVPYCAGAAASSVYTIGPVTTGGPTDSPAETTETSFDATSSLTTTATETATVTLTVDTTTVAASTEAETTTSASITATVTLEIPTVTTTLAETLTSVSTELPTILPTDTEVTVPTTSTLVATLTATFTSTAVIGLPYPTGNASGNATATTVGPPQQTGAATKFGVSGFALTIAMGLAFFL